MSYKYLAAVMSTMFLLCNIAWTMNHGEGFFVFWRAAKSDVFYFLLFLKDKRMEYIDF